ncbi:MAG: NaeI family type II restriction endonuclease [Phycisphaerales bacterium]
MAAGLFTNESSPDAERDAVMDWLGSATRVESIGRAIRSAIDFVIDGGRTRRFSIDQLQTSEKIYIGNRVEHSILYELDLPKIAPLDTTIAGLPVDIKFSIAGDWMIPPEAIAIRALCIVVSANDANSTYRVGVFRALEEHLAKPNRDGKRNILMSGKASIQWLGQDLPLPPNFLLHLAPDIRERVLAENPGQPAITQLFRLAIGLVVPRVAVETVARQLDPTKRVRDARIPLNAEGIDILSRRYDGPELETLGHTDLPLDCYVSVRR